MSENKGERRGGGSSGMTLIIALMLALLLAGLFIPGVASSTRTPEAVRGGSWGTLLEYAGNFANGTPLPGR
jgi:hypothetical protein